MNLLRSKLSIPVPGRGLVPRPRVVELLSVPEARVWLLAAPPGFGKTSAVVDWLQSTGRTAAWLSLDEADNDPGRFLPYLVAAIGGGGAGVDGLVHAVPDDPAEAAAELAALLQEPSASGLVVLDDFHLLTDRTVLAVVEALITRLPAGRILAIVTREDPPLRLARLRAAGQLTELRAEDLRFTVSETDAFLRRRIGLALPSEAVVALSESTEGWPAVLQLAGVSLAGRPDAAARAVMIGADHRLILDYVTEEVLQRLDADQVEFLETTCHLERLTGELCDAVTGRSDGAAMLRRLERENLLLVPLDDQRLWYRYHRLFAELLKIRRREVAGEVHRAAAVWFADHTLLVEALDHAVQVQDFGSVAGLIWQLGSRMLHLGEVPAVRAALGVLPNRVARTDLGVCLLHAWACVLAEPRHDPEGWLEAAAAAARPDAQLAPILPGMSLMIRALSASAGGRHSEAVELARTALRDGPPAAAQPRLALVYRGDGFTVLGHAMWDSGDTDRAVAAYLEALPLLREAGNWLAVAEMTANLAGIEQGRGRIDAALQLCDDYGERGTPADARVLMARARALLALGRAEAPDVARAALERATSAGDLRTLTEARRLLGSRAAGAAGLPNGTSLSARELEVLRLVAAGRSNAQIAAELFLTVGTVKSHVHSIATKLDTANRVETTARAREWGLLDA